MLRVYIASPYTIGTWKKNVERQIDMANYLSGAGFLPCWPLSSHYLDLRHSRPYEFWMNLDREELKRCDALLRLAGESVGADREVEWAKELGLPVFYHYADVVEWGRGPA